MLLDALASAADTIQQDWIGYELVDDLAYFADLYKNGSLSLLNGDLVRNHFSAQPNLLCAVVLLSFIAAVTTVCFVLFIFARYVLGGCGNERYQVSHKAPTSVKWFICFLVGFLFLWLMLSISALSMVLAASTLNSRFAVEDAQLDINHEFNGTETDRHIIINLDSVLIDQSEETPEHEIDEAEQLLGFKDLRELAYEFKPLDADSSYTLHAIVLWFLAGLYSLLALAAGVVVLLGTWQYLISYHPMERSAISNYCGHWAIYTSITFFALAPIALITGTVFLVYAHIHEMLCPLLQTVTQNQNMEDYVNLNYEIFDTPNLVDFLNDLLSERLELNQTTCHTFAAPMQRLWLAVVICSLISLPIVFVLLRISKYFLKMDSKYYWSQHETYSTIPEKEKGKPILQLQPVFCPPPMKRVK
uniref:Protein tweety homolog n=2 Tax=Panagrellus redivivus TaxID=6233 RepID=A0A7E4VQ38_PANRE